ncbi:MAG: hypothetical protein KKA64_03505 [Nanoarchaeota archaeon]|nr:hypothetical protein [Nanoarchaeota archaeon]
MAKEIRRKPHKLDDVIVTESIQSVNIIKQLNKMGGFIAGGMAVQSYIPPEEYRPTIDLDFNLDWLGGAANFKELTEPLKDYLGALGYSIKFRKKGLTYEYEIEKEGDSFLIQHPRRSKSYFEGDKKKSLRREITNERIVSKEGLKYAVLSPEDLVIHKLTRILKFSEEYDIKIPSTRLKNSADVLRTDLLSRGDNISPQDIARLRIYYDCVDVKCLSKYAGLNQNYFSEVKKDWRGYVQDDKFKSVLDRLEVSLE